MEPLQRKHSFYSLSPSTSSVAARHLLPRCFTPTRFRDESTSPKCPASKSQNRISPSPIVNVADQASHKRCEIIRTFTDFYKKQFKNVEFYNGKKACHQVIIPIISHSARSNFNWRSVSSCRKVEHIQEYKPKIFGSGLREIQAKSPILNDERRTKSLLNLLKRHETKLRRDEDSGSDLFLGNQIDPEYITTLTNLPKKKKKKIRIRRAKKLVPFDDKWGMYNLL